MRTLTWFTEDNKMVTADVVEVEASDICPSTDDHIASIEANSGWWEVYRLPDGALVAYFDEDEVYIKL